MFQTPTPHISAKPGDFGKTVLMPGDPLRSKFIAEHFLENPVLVNNVRGVQGYTGTYKGVKVSVMALEMESAALYMNAARYGKRALCICTISDHVLTGEETTSEERQTAFTTMMKVALETAVKMEGK